MATQQSPFLDVSSEFQPELSDIQRKQRLAQLLTQQGMQAPQGQVVSGRYVAPSIAQNIANMFSVYSGQNLEKETENRQQALAQKLRQAEAKDLQGFIEAGRSAPEQTVYGAGVEGPTMTVTPEVKPDYRKQLAIALGSQSPTVRALGTEMLKQSITPTKVGPDESLVVRDFLGGGAITPIITGAPKLGQELRDAARQARLDITKVDQWTDADWARVRDIEARIAAGKRPVTNVMVNTEQTYGGALAKTAADEDKLLRSAAVSAPEIVSKVARNKKILDSGNFFSGKGANIQQEMAMFADAVGLGGQDTATKAANTQSLIQGSAETTLNSIKSSGLGSGQGFTDKDREFLQDAKSFRITMNRENIKRVLDLEEKAAIESAKKWNQRVKQLPKSATVPIGYGEVEVPTAYGQSNVRSQADQILGR